MTEDDPEDIVGDRLERLETISRSFVQEELQLVILETVYLMYHMMSDDKRCQAYVDKWLPVIWKKELSREQERREEESRVHKAIRDMNVDELSTQLREEGEVLRKRVPEMSADTIQMFREMQELMKVITLRSP